MTPRTSSTELHELYPELTAEQLDEALDQAEALNLSPEVAGYLLSRGVAWPRVRPLHKSPEPRALPGAYFNPASVDRLLKVCRLFQHTEGRYAGRPFTAEPWQVAYALAPVFGWLRLDDEGLPVRVIRTLWLEIPRKNGKSTLCAVLGLYLLVADREPGAQVYAAASSKRQAAAVFEPSRRMALASPEVSKRVRPMREVIAHKSSGSVYRVVAADADKLHGLNVHGALVDEVHVHDTRDLIDVLETGTGSRSQPLVAFITTADDGKPESVYDEKRRLVESHVAGTYTDPTLYGVVFAADEAADPFAEATWEAANPGIDVTVRRDYLHKEAERAKASPAYLNTFLRLHLNRRTRQDKRWLALSTWDESAGMVDRAALRGRKAFGGIDLASSSDLASLAWVVPDGEGSFDALWRVWLPEDRLPALNERTAGAGSRWVREGWLTVTPGNVIDYRAILAGVDEDARHFDVAELAFDRWGMTQLSQDLSDEGLELFPMGQGFASMGPPTKELLRLLLERKLRHGGNPLVRWTVDNLAVRTDPAGNVKPDKAKSGDKIDPVVALVMAVDRALRHQPKPKRRAVGF
jgi:phage terminase large subunit-like protein